jgi:hypothetical protein
MEMGITNQIVGCSYGFKNSFPQLLLLVSINIVITHIFCGKVIIPKTSLLCYYRHTSGVHNARAIHTVVGKNKVLSTKNSRGQDL